MTDTESATLVTLLPPEMREAIEEVARTENRQPGELVEEAVRQYLKDRHWHSLVTYGQERAHSLSYQPSDVNRLIAESRSERGR
jgi:metal-responsive CopG/Arc/MetJ family transcriptional regulator